VQVHVNLRRAGIECPRDVSVIGFDDMPIAGYAFPTLTSMRQPREEIGRLATQTLIDLIDGTVKTAEPIRIVLRSELVARESTAPLRA